MAGALLGIGLIATTAHADLVGARIANGLDDGFLIQDGRTPDLTAPSLPLGRGSGGGPPFRTVLLRFTGVDIPAGARIQTAQLRLEPAAADAGRTNLLIRGEYSADAAPYPVGADAVSGRALTSASVAWSNVPPWGATTASSPDLVPIINEIISHPG